MQEGKLNNLSNPDFIKTIFICNVGLGGFIFGSNLSRSVGKSGMIFILIAGLVVYISMLLVYKAMELNHFRSFDIVVEKAFGTIIGKLFIIEMIITLLIITSVQLRVYALAAGTVLLERTAIELIIVTYLIIAIYLARGGSESVVRFNQIIAWIVIVPVVILLVYCMFRGEIKNALPLVDLEKKELLVGFKDGIEVFGAILLIYFFIPLLKDKKSVPKLLFKSISLSTVYYVLLFFTFLTFFGAQKLEDFQYPFISMVKNINEVSSFFERLDSIIVTVFLLSTITAFCNLFYFLSELIKKIFCFSYSGFAMAVTIPLVYLFSRLPQNIASVNAIRSYILPILLAINLVIIPILIILFSKKRGENREKK